MKKSHIKSGADHLVHVYAARYPFPVDDGKITPARAEEIESCLNSEVRLQKFYAWKLLESALKQSLCLSIDELDIRRTDNGKWECQSCCFSLSHSGGFVAVAVSDEPVGIDIERCDESRFTTALAEKIATERERKEIERLKNPSLALNALWTKKEAVFKLLGDKAFLPKAIETANYETAIKTLKCGDESYFVTVACSNADKAKFYL